MHLPKEFIELLNAVTNKRARIEYYQKINKMNN